MPTNIHVDWYTQQNEQRLLDDLSREAVQFHGMDMLYSPRTLIAEDKLLNEDPLSAFKNAFEIEMYISDIDQFGGDGDLISKFGLEIRDTVDLVVSTSRFEEITGKEKPSEGDLIYFPLSKGLFEITFVEDEFPFYPLGSKPTMKLSCQLFEYSQEDLDTGVTAIDDIERTFENLDNEENDPFADNTVIETEADDVIDFTETNPFGNF